MATSVKPILRKPLVFDVSALGEDALSIIINGQEVAREE